MKRNGLSFTESDLHRIIRESINKVLFDGKHISSINEYLDRNYGVPLYKRAKEEFEGVGIVKNEWLVHSFLGGEDVGKDIMDNGFSNGLSRDDLSRYNMIWATGKHEDHGYSWAYRAERFTNGRRRKEAYGDSILFQASGVEYYNPADNGLQVMFYNKSARNKILIYEWDGEENVSDKFSEYHERTLYGVGNINGKPLYVGYFGDVIEWCITNFVQYRKYLLSNIETPHVSDEMEAMYEEYLDSTGFSNLPDDSANLYSKWHDYQEELEDREHYNELIKSEYKKFLANHRDEITKITLEICDEIDPLLAQCNNDYYAERNLRKSYMERKLIAAGLDYYNFADDFQKKHVFYDRKRKDDRYWKY